MWGCACSVLICHQQRWTFGGLRSEEQKQGKTIHSMDLKTVTTAEVGGFEYNAAQMSLIVLAEKCGTSRPIFVFRMTS